jgi:Zn-dependent metalloprotease
MSNNCFFSHRCIIPPDILKRVVENGTDRQRQWALEELTEASRLRGQRDVAGFIAPFATIAAGTKRRTIYDAASTTALPGTLVRGEGDPSNGDVAADEAYDGSGTTYDFFKKVYERNSVDDTGMRLDSTVHYGVGYANAFWNGRQMVYGDGDGEIFNRFTTAIDVIAHELTHGVTQFEAGLIYEGQSGALNEHFSDVFGSLVKQYRNNQQANQADWLIGAGLFTANVHGDAIRSMKAPGTAYDDPLIGRDPQPAHMDDFVETSEDNGGVHINSGIPNKAFYELATALGGYAWDAAGTIWYVTLRDRLRPTSEFQYCAEQTASVAADLYGRNSIEHKAVKAAWRSVGINIVAPAKKSRFDTLHVGAGPRLAFRRPARPAAVVAEGPASYPDVAAAG